MKTIIILLLSCCLYTQHTQAQTRQTDSLALVMFYDSCCNTGCTLNWDFTQSMDNWNGVSMNNGRVTGLSVTNKGLSGPVLDLNLSSLLNLRLDRNQLTGNIPNFSNLPNLGYLYLDRNQLSGAIPDFSNLPNLQRLILYNNQLSGSIPNLNNLSNLQQLILNDNQLSGAIPSFSNLPNLKRLILYNNQLSGSIPNFSNLPNLEILHLFNNQLSGSIPNFSNFANLELLYLYDNQLSGSIPNLNLPNLRGLLLYNNQLTGSIPNFINLISLQELLLYNNQLTGSIPDFNLSNLRYLQLERNQLSSTIPNFSALSSLIVLRLDRNELSGVVPSFSTSPNLGQVHIYGNQFTFSDLLPSHNTFIAFGNTYQYYGQDSIGTNISATPSIGGIYTIDLVIDDTVSSNIYYWYKDGILIDSTFGINEYTITNFQAVDVGTYTAEIKNTIMTNPTVWQQNLVLQSRPVTLSLATNIEKIANSPALKVYPNPASDILYIHTQNVQTDYHVQVYNLQGQVMQNLSGQNAKLFMLPIADYPSGVYIVQLQAGAQVWQEKIIKP